jgi:hypothetical protein
MTDTPELDDNDILLWRDFPSASAPVEWIKWTHGPEGHRWSTRDHRSALAVIDAAQRFDHDDPDGAVAALVRSGVPMARLAQTAVYHLMILIACSYDPHGFADHLSAGARMRPGSTVHGDVLSTIAIAEAAAEFVAVAPEDREGDPCHRMHQLLAECPTPLPRVAVSTCRVLGALWSEQSESFDGLRQLHVRERGGDE